MKPGCPNFECHFHQLNFSVHKHGSFYRPSDGRKVIRYRCINCLKSFSNATFDAAFNHNKRRINYQVYKLLCSGVSQRRAARLLNVNKITIARKLRFLGQKLKLKNQLFLKNKYEESKVKLMQFDDLQTIEHTKCKPVSISLAVEEESRIILGFEVSKMPATGHLAKVARKKYGLRKDERRKGLDSLFKQISPLVEKNAFITSDQHPYYLPKVRKYLPNSTYTQVKGARGSLGGQGELKKLEFDPLFSLNHTCAMLRANINRLIRRTWCTTKCLERLKDHLQIYMHYHNTVLV